MHWKCLVGALFFKCYCIFDWTFILGKQAATRCWWFCLPTSTRAILTWFERQGEMDLWPNHRKPVLPASHYFWCFLKLLKSWDHKESTESFLLQTTLNLARVSLLSNNDRAYTAVFDPYIHKGFASTPSPPFSSLQFNLGCQKWFHFFFQTEIDLPSHKH